MNIHTVLSFSANPVLRPLRLLLAALTLLLSSACATSTPDFGGSVAMEGDQYNAISAKWLEGRKLLSRGQKKVGKARKQISDGQEDLADGEAMVRRGQRLMTESEEEYKLKKAF